MCRNKNFWWFKGWKSDIKVLQAVKSSEGTEKTGHVGLLKHSPD